MSIAENIALVRETMADACRRAGRDEEDVKLGEACLPKSIKSGAMWKAPSPEYAKTSAQAEERMEEFRAERLNAFREEAEKNG